MITTILFDLDGVLVDSFEANLLFLQQLFVKAGYEPPSRKTYTHLFHASLVEVIKTVTKSTSQEEINRIMTLGNDHRSDIYPYDKLKTPTDLYTVVQMLHKTYTLGIVTSRIKSGTENIPQLQQIRKCFDIIVTYEDTKEHKPHPEPLTFAVRKLHSDPAKTVYIGDQQTDVLAAKAAHVQSIILSQNPFPQATRCIHSFSDIPTVLTSFF